MKRSAACFLSVPILLAACATSPQPRGAIDWKAAYELTRSAGLLAAGEWAEDLDFLVRTLEARHPNPWHGVSRFSFLETLHAPLPEGLGPADLAEARAANVARALATVGEVHTALIPQAELSRVLPITLARGADGFYVMAAREDKGDASTRPVEILGGRIVSLNGVPAEEAFAALAPWASAENELGFREAEARLAAYAGYLVAAGISKRSDASVRIEAEIPGGEGAPPSRKWRDVPFLRKDSPEYARLGSVNAFQARGAVPASTLGNGEAYRYLCLPDRGAVFFQYNSCSETKGRPFRDFCAELFDVIGKQKPQRLVIDLRNNGGGDSSLFTFQFLPRLKASYLNEKGRLFALVGPGVLSSGVFAAAELRTQTRAILVGEPTGEGGTHYGYTGYFSLPRSGLAVMHSTTLWRRIPGDDSPAILPDVPVPQDIPAILAGRDPCAEAAFSYGR